MRGHNRDHKPLDTLTIRKVNVCPRRALSRDNPPKDIVMIRTLIAAAIAAAIISPVTANAGNFERRTHHSRHHAQMWRAPVSMQRGYDNPGRLRNQTARPPWAGPAECYEDLGYGRFESCDSRW